MVGAERVRISAVSHVEAAAAVDRLGDPVLSRRLDELLDLPSIAIEPFDGERAMRARAAYRDFGRGSGHRARLSFGDCCAHALATSQGEPLLFKGDDFAYTVV
ncbi:MAG: ribonuclease VapC [Actinomycetota bacterium]|nr:ribonuclease VapC [Actinomycetota bacterium]